MTDGGHGLGIALGGDDGTIPPPVFVPAFAGVVQVDTTGAGDAAFGGVIASLHARGLPVDAAGLERMGRVAAAAGAACVEVQGTGGRRRKEGARFSYIFMHIWTFWNETSQHIHPIQ